MLEVRVTRAKKMDPVTTLGVQDERWGGLTTGVLCAEAANLLGMPEGRDFVLLVAKDSFEGSAPVDVVDFMTTYVNEKKFVTGRYSTLEGLIAAALGRKYDCSLDCTGIIGQRVFIGWRVP